MKVIPLQALLIMEALGLGIQFYSVLVFLMEELLLGQVSQ
jgi:hypothetical protein